MKDLLRNFCFTLNNYTQEDIDYLENNFFEGYCSYLIYGKEKATTGTNHLQGYVQLKKRTRFNTIKKYLKSYHIEDAKGSAEQNRAYCSKELDYKEFGTIKVERSNSYKKENIRELIKQCNTWRDVLEIEGIEKYMKFAREYFNSLDRRNKDIYKDIQLYEWQQLLIEYMDNPGNSRDILIVIDTEGGKGKSFFCAYCQTMRDDVFISSMGKTADVLYCYRSELKKNILLDTQRDSNFRNLNWNLVESISNRFFTSTKYESVSIIKPILTNTILFTNDDNINEIIRHLSKDRVKLLNLSNLPYSINSYELSEIME